MKRSAQLVPRKSASRHPPTGPMEARSRHVLTPSPPSVPLSARSYNHETFRAARTSQKRFPSPVASMGTGIVLRNNESMYTFQIAFP